MNDPMQIIKFDHRDVRELLAKLAESEEGEERNALVEEVTTKLTAHMVMEETLIYPAVAEKVGEEDEEEAEIEHGLAREGLEKLNSMKDAPGFGAVVEMLKGGIEHHVQEEEKEILPELKDQMERGGVVGTRRPHRRGEAARRTAAPRRDLAAPIDQAQRQREGRVEEVVRGRPEVAHAVVADSPDLSDTAPEVQRLVEQLGGRAVAVAESCTAGQVVARFAAAGGAERFLRGGIVSYQEQVKRDVLGVTAASVLSEEAAEQMARGIAAVLSADVAVATTGVVGTEPVEGRPPGRVFIGTCVDGHTSARTHSFSGAPHEIARDASVQAIRDLARALGV